MAYIFTVFQHIPREFADTLLRQVADKLRPGGIAVFNLISEVNENLNDGVPETEWAIGYSRRQAYSLVADAGIQCERIVRLYKLMFEYEQMSWLEPKPCSVDMIELLERHSRDMGYKTIIMPSGAGHDSQFFTDITPTGLLFIPSVGGISHAPDEWSHWHDVEKGCNVLLNAALELLDAE